LDFERWKELYSSLSQSLRPIAKHCLEQVEC
jgi:hypothetical protein